MQIIKVSISKKYLKIVVSENNAKQKIYQKVRHEKVAEIEKQKLETNLENVCQKLKRKTKFENV